MKDKKQPNPDAVLRRMLNTPPQPQVKKTKKSTKKVRKPR
jgi:hypothetical protein